MSAACLPGSQVTGDSQVTFPVTVLSPPVPYNSLRAARRKASVSRLGFEEAVMNDKTGGIRIPRRAGALAVVATAAVLAAGCASSGASTSSVSGPGQPTYAQELALAQCMRGHGVPNFPNPSASGGFSLNSSMLDSSQVQAAYGGCRHLVPGAPSISQILQEQQEKQAQELPALLKWEQCVRGHGEPDFSLGVDGQSPPAKSSGFNADTPQFQAAVNACQHLLPPGAHVSVNTSTSRS
jgi:hypothetical protein